MEYLKNTHLKRAHVRSTMKRNLNAYYRATENLINLSQYNNIIMQLLPNILDHQLYQLKMDQNGKQIVDFENLQQHNKNNIQEEDEEDNSNDEEDENWIIVNMVVQIYCSLIHLIDLVLIIEYKLGINYYKASIGFKNIIINWDLFYYISNTPD